MRFSISSSHVKSNRVSAVCPVTINVDDERLYLNVNKKSLYVETDEGRKIHVLLITQATTDESTNTHSNPSPIRLFFIHGVGGSVNSWDVQVNYFLNHGYDVVCIDLLGHGLSSSPRNMAAYEFCYLAADVLTVFDRFCRQKNVLIGHSYGASFCALLSKERSRYIAKIVLISGGGPTALSPSKCDAFCLPSFMFSIIKPMLVKTLRRMAFHAHAPRAVRQKITTFDMPSNTLKAVMRGQIWSEPDEAYYADLLLPVLLICGDDDQFVTLDEVVWMNETINGSELEVIKNAGHMVMLEAPTVVNATIHKFLDRDESTRSKPRQSALFTARPLESPSSSCDNRKQTDQSETHDNVPKEQALVKVDS